MKISANGLSLEVQLEGEAGPWVIFSHSIMTNLSMWEEQAAILRRNFRTVRYDTRGHGRSDAPPAPYDMQDLVNDALGVMDALSIEKAHFVGLSLGGTTAIGLAIAHPERLLSVVVCDARADAPASLHTVCGTSGFTPRSNTVWWRWPSQLCSDGSRRPALPRGRRSSTKYAL
jgi:3-oxoadipate enol-lactonase